MAWGDSPKIRSHVYLPGTPGPARNVWKPPQVPPQLSGTVRQHGVLFRDTILESLVRRPRPNLSDPGRREASPPGRGQLPADDPSGCQPTLADPVVEAAQRLWMTTAYTAQLPLPPAMWRGARSRWGSNAPVPRRRRPLRRATREAAMRRGMPLASPPSVPRRRSCQLSRRSLKDHPGSAGGTPPRLARLRWRGCSGPACRAGSSPRPPSNRLLIPRPTATAERRCAG